MDYNGIHYCEFTVQAIFRIPNLFVHGMKGRTSVRYPFYIGGINALVHVVVYLIGYEVSVSSILLFATSDYV